MYLSQWSKFMFDKPGQYKVYVASWKMMIVCAIIISILCFLGGWWVGRKNNYGEMKTGLDDINVQVLKSKKQMDALLANNIDLERRLVDVNDRLILLSCLFNENFAIHQAKSSDFIFIEREWKINRLPKQLDLSQQDKEWLMMFLNNEAANAASRVIPK